LPLRSIHPRDTTNGYGGTIDVTSYEIQKNSELKELHIPSGGPWGGTCIDREYLAFLENLFGRDVWSEFIKSLTTLIV
jgi:hypothetical protein